MKPRPHTLTDLSRLERDILGRHVAAFTADVDKAARLGHSHPESIARHHKVEAYRFLNGLGFTPDETVAAFRQALDETDQGNTE